MNATRTAKTDKEEALENLRGWIKPGDTVYTVCRHVSSSGMTRHIGVVLMLESGPIHPNYAVSKALDYRRNKNGDGIVVGGCGMDMGFHVVYELGQVLFRDGFGCIGDKCPSNDHSNGDRDYTPHGHRGPRYDGTKESLKHWHTSGGYALRQRWL